MDDLVSPAAWGRGEREQPTPGRGKLPAVDGWPTKLRTGRLGFAGLG